MQRRGMPPLLLLSPSTRFRDLISPGGRSVDVHAPLPLLFLFFFFFSWRPCAASCVGEAASRCRRDAGHGSTTAGKTRWPRKRARMNALLAPRSRSSHRVAVLQDEVKNLFPRCSLVVHGRRSMASRAYRLRTPGFFRQQRDNGSSEARVLSFPLVRLSTGAQRVWKSARLRRAGGDNEMWSSFPLGRRRVCLCVAVVRALLPPLIAQPRARALT